MRRPAGQDVRLWGATRLFFAAVALLAGIPVAEAGMPVAPGDVLRVAVVEAPTIEREAKVDAEGRIMLPQLGGIAVAGHDLDAVRRQIEAALISNDIVRTPTVLVEIASYRPFYVGGAVARPGAMPFEPGLTVRHALILAGGIAPKDRLGRISPGEVMQLKSRWTAVSYRLVNSKSLVARLEAELADSAAPDFSAVEARGISPAAAASIVSLDAHLFRDKIEGRAAQEEHLQNALELVDLEIDVLTQQSALEIEERALQKEQVENARRLVERGVIPLPRLQELEREASRLSRDILTSQSYAARARQNKASRQHELKMAKVESRMLVREDLRKAKADLALLEVEAEALASALQDVGLSLAGDGEPEPKFTIHRLAGGTSERLEASWETPILPGDVLDVAMEKAPHG